jgi:hypothetical protein
VKPGFVFEIDSLLHVPASPATSCAILVNPAPPPQPSWVPQVASWEPC